jgi:hypothetical protein
MFRTIRGVDDLPGMHVDADFVTDNVLPWGRVG